MADIEEGNAEEAARVRRQNLRAQRRNRREGDDSNAIVGTEEPSNGVELPTISKDRDDKDSENKSPAAGGVVRRRESRGGVDDTADDKGVPEERSKDTDSKDRLRDKEKDKEKDREEPPVESPKSTPASVPTVLKVLEPARTDPVKALQARQRRIERLSVTSMPEVPYC